MKKKCTKCGEVKSLTDFSKNKRGKDGLKRHCKTCDRKFKIEYRSTERGYLRYIYYSITSREKITPQNPISIKCHFTFEEFLAAWEKHKSIYGMRSAWGPGIDKLEEHLPITMIHKGEGKFGRGGCVKGSKRIRSNLSVDRLDNNIDYTLQNIIFIRNDENARKRDASYNDCKIQMRLHEERFINMEAI
jgi:hypothetical protein